jgi:hypothetical protein
MMFSEYSVPSADLSSGQVICRADVVREKRDIKWMNGMEGGVSDTS